VFVLSWAQPPITRAAMPARTRRVTDLKFIRKHLGR
jgi:hypothetical protein